MKSLSYLFKIFIDALFPKRCIVCNDLSDQNSYFCKDCVGKIQPEKYIPCKKCACDINLCDCDRFFYHFDGVCAPFSNEGVVKESFYAYKFYSNFSGIDYFAENMFLKFKEVFGDMEIDIVCYVPVSKKQLTERRYDKCELLAKRIAKLMDKPLENIILKRENIKTQHNLVADERFENTADAYMVIRKVKGKTVLLVDDIKTTGATLDACARELKFSGAKAVYCLTCLVSNK